MMVSDAGRSTGELVHERFVHQKALGQAREVIDPLILAGRHPVLSCTASRWAGRQVDEIFFVDAPRSASSIWLTMIWRFPL